MRFINKAWSRRLKANNSKQPAAVTSSVELRANARTLIQWVKRDPAAGDSVFHLDANGRAPSVTTSQLFPIFPLF